MKLTLPLLVAATLALGGTARAAIVINEIDYDQPGTDTQEFIELYNNGASAVSLANLSIRLVNGADNLQYGQIDLPSTLLAAGAYFVVCNSGGTVANCNLAALAASNAVQNGSPDGVALVDNVSQALLSTLSYEGPITAAVLTGFAGPVNLVNGTALASTVADDNVTPNWSLSRVPNGVSTGNDSVDWQLAFSTPGSANALPAVPEPAQALMWMTGLLAVGAALRRRPQGRS